MERKIYFNTHFVILSDGKNTKFSGETYICNNKTEILHIITTYIEHANTDIAILFEDFETLCAEFKKHFRYIEAAGGLVANERGEVLCIYRNNVWDLPKGKAEQGETTEQTAVREVCEETGLQMVQCDAYLCSTWHTYPHPKGTVLKQTYWYTMHSSLQQVLTPQTIEGITNIEWIPVDNLHTIIAETYASIRDVFEEYGY